MSSKIVENGFNDSRALVTGASSGIGRATARKLASLGADVAIAARSEDSLETVAETIGEEEDGDALAVPTDVTDESQVERMVSRTVEEFGGLDVVVSNAGTGRGGPIAEMTTEDYRAVTSVNVDGMFFTAREVTPHLIESTGNLVLVGSSAGKFPRTEYPVYAASKWWTRGFALSLAGQLGRENVSVSVVNPGNTRTMFGSEYRDANRNSYDEGEALEAEDIADAIAYAASCTAPATIGEIDVVNRDAFSGM
ncbi:SDR family oxidoreductase [Natrarchaeobius chitinivorans]|uniref:SDR family oxidoreductase n=1 Tax=Natrarchaeobius chitinivorans TaxID=1679083 RepID=A0A3N6P993_NATCH|nr:SDR family oxidoreductase [Natrarchaeobius chitinivorans]RQG95429.1 SDR family oxidoreductase [Natrarchaeobius chitinivorans]